MKNHVAVVPSDHLIMVEGEPLFFEFTPLFPMRALQWKDGTGHIEVQGKANRTLNSRDYPLEVLPYVALFEAEKQRRARVDTESTDLDPEEPCCIKAYNTKLQEILGEANRVYQQVTARYSIPEQQSWEKQKAQALALLLDENAEAPEVRTLAANRGIPVLMFARRILDNATKAEALTLSIILQQQSYEDVLEAAKTLEEIAAVKVNYKLAMEETE